MFVSNLQFRIMAVYVIFLHKKQKLNGLQSELKDLMNKTFIGQICAIFIMYGFLQI